jgi:hypothetical protein
VFIDHSFFKVDLMTHQRKRFLTKRSYLVLALMLARVTCRRSPLPRFHLGCCCRLAEEQPHKNLRMLNSNFVLLLRSTYKT